MPRLSHAKFLKANEVIAQMYERSLEVGHPHAAAWAIHELLGGTVACTMLRRKGARPLVGMSEAGLGAQIYALPSEILSAHPFLGKRPEVVRLSKTMSVTEWRRHEFYQSVKPIFRHYDELGVDVLLPDVGCFSICLMRDRLAFTGEDEELLRLMVPHLVAMARMPTSHPREPALELLTRREGEITRWIAKGKTNDELARILGISPSTVKRHLENIYRKLGVENRFGLISVALRSAPEGE